MEHNSQVMIAPETAPVELNPVFPRTEQFSLRAKWMSLMYRDLGDEDITAMEPFWCFRDWTIDVPRYLGTSLALDDAAKCYLACKMAFVDPTDINRLAFQTSNSKAVNSVRLALGTKWSRPIHGSMLLAVYMLYIVEVSCSNRSGENSSDRHRLSFMSGLDVA